MQRDKRRNPRRAPAGKLAPERGQRIRVVAPTSQKFERYRVGGALVIGLIDISGGEIGQDLGECQALASRLI